MSSPVHNKVYLITGSASGMGRATAQTLLFRGAKVAACDINGKNLDELYNNLQAAKQRNTLTGLIDGRRATSGNSLNRQNVILED
jgi:NAD(P)-dependent dehydrogenase (short-subunit alcohol dehydrogenase family)